ncbi:MAG: hypothetical protein M1834_005121 [Cirrosporium novae-zelandiae]|nr:MAG: hypothetical protein M1834_005121 [Cirrosporium novae-zelandiae]
MLAQRTVQRSLRRLAASQSSVLAISRTTRPAAIISASPKSIVQTRYVATQNMKEDEAYSILVEQRKNRPVSPHLTVYKPQITWVPSMFNRITGSILSGGMYVFATAYLVAPLFGWHLESAALAAAFGAWPLLAKVAVKMSLALPFTFHSFNGLRHLMWDMGKTINNKMVMQTGWTAVGASVVASLALALFI